MTTHTARAAIAVTLLSMLTANTAAAQPTQGAMLRKGETLAIPTGVPMRLVVTGSTVRRQLAVIVHDAAQPPTMRMEEGTRPPLVACR